MESTEDDKGMGRMQRLLRVYEESANMYKERAENYKILWSVWRMIRVWGECG